MGCMAKNTPPPRHGGGWDEIGSERMIENEIGSSGMGEGRVFQRDLERMKQEGDELSIGQENGQ